MCAVAVRRSSATAQHLDSPAPFMQETLVVFLDVIKCVRTTSQLDSSEWPLERISIIMTILKGVSKLIKLST